MNANISVVSTQIQKVSVTITRRALWDNFVMCWKDTAWDDYENAGPLMRDVAMVLTARGKIDYGALRRLFREGATVMLMGEGMDFLDTINEIHREIIVDDDGEKYVIRHGDINF